MLAIGQVWLGIVAGCCDVCVLILILIFKVFISHMYRVTGVIAGNSENLRVRAPT